MALGIHYHQADADLMIETLAKDGETIELVNRRGAAMVLTGQRHFKH